MLFTHLDKKILILILISLPISSYFDLYLVMNISCRALGSQHGGIQTELFKKIITLFYYLFFHLLSESFQLLES